MAEKKNKVKSNPRAKKTKFKAIKEKSFSLITRALNKVAAVPAILFGVVKKAPRKFWALPKVVRIFSLYLLTVLVASSIFFWRMEQLRTTNPPVEPPFSWSSEEPTIGPEQDEEEEKEKDEPEPEPEPEPVGAETPPPFIKGFWPVRGELYYAYKDVIERHPGVYSFAEGIGVKGSAGTETVAAWEGLVAKVIEIGYPYGAEVVINHDNGITVYYGALADVTVKEGQRVSQNQKIGVIAPGQRNQPDHLFLKMLKDGVRVDPVLYLIQ